MRRMTVSGGGISPAGRKARTTGERGRAMKRALVSHPLVDGAGLAGTDVLVPAQAVRRPQARGTGSTRLA